jgi:hypothetical protein
MLFYYEPLSLSLARTQRFEAITIVGRHSDVVIFRCTARSLRTKWRRFIGSLARR